MRRKVSIAEQKLRQDWGEDVKEKAACEGEVWVAGTWRGEKKQAQRMHREADRQIHAHT